MQRSGIVRSVAPECQSKSPDKIMSTHLSGDANSQKAGLHKGQVFADHKASLKRCCKFEDAECYRDQ